MAAPPPNPSPRRLLSIGSILATLFVVGACTPAGTSQTPPTGGTGEVAATLSEWKVDVSAASVPAGRVTFSVTNRGAIAHEFLVIRTDTLAADLPVKDNMIDVMAMGGPMGSGMDMPGMSAAPDMEHPAGTVGVIEQVAAGAADQLVLDDLTPGHYVIICDLPAHYQQGMRTDFTAN